MIPLGEALQVFVATLHLSMFKKSTFSSLLFLCSCFAYSQNIVVNPRFDTSDSLRFISEAIGATHGEKNIAEFDGCIPGWYRVRGFGKPSVHSTKHQSRKLVIPEHGTGSIGLTLFAPASDDYAFHSRDYIDYVFGELTEPLAIDSAYLIKIRIKNQVLWPNGNQYSVCCNNTAKTKVDTSHIFRLVRSSNVGMYFFEDKSFIESINTTNSKDNLYHLEPQFEYCKLLKVEDEWTTIKAVFKANNAGRYFILGNFRSSEDTKSNMAVHERETFHIHDAIHYHHIKEERTANYFFDYIEISPCTAEAYDLYRNENCAQMSLEALCENELGLAPYLPSAQNPNPQRVCYIGNYDLAFSDSWNNSLSDFPSEDIDGYIQQGYQKKNAIDEIIDVAQDYDIICINEQHVNSEHRAYVNNILEGLYDNGYRYLFVEALDWNLPLSEYNNPMNQPRTYWGPYVRDPVFAHLLRKAVNLGFKIFPYEPTAAQEKDAYTMMQDIFPEAKHDTSGWYMTPDGTSHTLAMGELTMTARDYAMSNNINAIIQKYGFEKSVIFGGGQHFLPTSCGFVYSTFHWLQKSFPIKSILSVNQITASDTFADTFQSPTVLANDKNQKYYASDRKCFSSGLTIYESDITVIHPYYARKNQNRPSWLALHRDRKKFSFKSPNDIEYPFVLTAYSQGSDIQCDVPEDAVEYINQANDLELFLSPGCYDLYFITKNAVKHKFHCFK